VVPLLLQHGADIFAKDYKDRTPFDRALQGNHIEMFKELVKKAKELHRNDEISHGSSAESDFSFQMSEIDLFKQLQNRHRDDKGYGSDEGEDSEGHFDSDAESDSEFDNEEAYGSDSDIERHVGTRKWFYVMPALHATISAGNVELAKAILHKSWAKVNVKNRSGGTALHHAVAEGQYGCLLMLLDHGADINAQDYNKKTPLCLAAACEARECFRILLEHKADVSVLRSSREARQSYFGWYISKDLLQILADSGVEI
jgi:ankyrin repeat protein